MITLRCKARQEVVLCAAGASTADNQHATQRTLQTLLPGVLTCAIMWQGGSAMSGSAAGFQAVRMSRLHSGLVLRRLTSPASWSTPWPGANSSTAAGTVQVWLLCAEYLSCVDALDEAWALACQLFRAMV
jgi:hypothetical protein